MKRKWTGIRMVFSICAALGWWGMLYPELTMTPDTYIVVTEEGPVEEADGDIYYRMLGAGEGRIRFKSKFMTQIDAFIEYLK